MKFKHLMIAASVAAISITGGCKKTEGDTAVACRRQ